MYGTLEEEHGLAKRAMNIYERACGAVSDQDKFDVTIFIIHYELVQVHSNRTFFSYSQFTLRKQPLTLVSPQLAPFTNVPLKCCLTNRRHK